MASFLGAATGKSKNDMLMGALKETANPAAAMAVAGKAGNAVTSTASNATSSLAHGDVGGAVGAVGSGVAAGVKDVEKEAGNQVAKGAASFAKKESQK